ncbi:hypothetical protein CDD81_368 [Ophiocordyceps australis]|uniref:Uncharacterized protein n=1 Tax=Ophiocordyceps australis TaxID=1399860 RepID=A0A2C5Y220_9HYPO|nr:hypothetical protein CDD81_368 [Ophiocordyceps australis]
MYTLTEAASRYFGRVYMLDLRRTSQGGLAATASDGLLRILDAQHLEQSTEWQTGHRKVTGLECLGQAVCTAGEDGMVCVWDVRAREAAVRFQVSKAPITAMCCSQTQIIAIGTELYKQEASILLWDIRSTPQPSTKYTQLHSDDITALSTHANLPSALVSASADGLVGLHDMRIVDEDEATLLTHNLGASVHRAGFLSSEMLFALSSDELFALYPIGHGKTLEFGDLRKVLSCRYVADVLPKTDGSGAMLGAGNQGNHAFNLIRLSRTSVTDWSFDPAASVRLPGAHGAEVVRAYCFFDEHQLVFTAGEDGNIRAWRPGGEH